MIPVLIALLLKSALVAGLALLVVAGLGERTPAERALVLRVAVVTLLILPLVALFGPDLTIWVAQTPALPEPPQAVVAAAFTPQPETAVRASLTLPSIGLILGAAWSLGAVLLLARFGLGVATLARWSRAGRAVAEPGWTMILDRLTPSGRRPALRACKAVAAPLSWGVAPGEVLIGPAQLARPDQAEAILAHELAHLRRADWLFLALSRIAAALFWFNPLVWLVAGRLEHLSEEAADAEAVRGVDREIYARALVGMAACITPGFIPRAATGMTGPARSLAKRISNVMTERRPVASRPVLIGVAVAALVAVATPIAAMEFSARAQDEGTAVPVAVASATTAAAVAADAAADTASLPAPRRSDVTIHGGREPTHVSVIHNGTTHRYVVNQGEAYRIQSDGTRRPLTLEERQEVERAGAEAHEAANRAREAATAARAHARVQVEEARSAAHQARGVAEQARAAAMAHAATAERHRNVDRVALREQVARAHAAADEARAHAARARVDQGRIREQVAREMANVRAQLAEGAEGMERGARQMREEAGRLRDPAYRARQIEEQRERGQTVTDQELIDAIPKMLEGADRMDEGAARMRGQARGRN